MKRDLLLMAQRLVATMDGNRAEASTRQRGIRQKREKRSFQNVRRFVRKADESVLSRMIVE